MVLTSRRAQSTRPEHKRFPSALASPAIPEFRDFARSGNSQFAMRVSISVALVMASKIISKYLSDGVFEFHQPTFHVSLAFLLTNKYHGDNHSAILLIPSYIQLGGLIFADWKWNPVVIGLTDTLAKGTMPTEFGMLVSVVPILVAEYTSEFEACGIHTIVILALTTVILLARGVFPAQLVIMCIVGQVYLYSLYQRMHSKYTDLLLHRTMANDLLAANQDFAQLQQLCPHTAEEQARRVDIICSKHPKGDRYFQNLELRADEVQVGGIIGEGGFSTVHDVLLNGQPFAGKQLKTAAVSDGTIRSFLDEVCFCEHSWHPNLTTFAGIVRCPLMIIMEKYTGGTMLDRIKSQKQNKLSDYLPLICGVLRGLHYLHTLPVPVMHGDIKAANIMIDDSGEAKLIDLGSKDIVTATHMAPERAEGIHTTKSDIFSLGMTLVEVLNVNLSTAVIPMSPDDQFRGIGADAELVDWLILAEYADRPTAAAVINHLAAKPQLIGGLQPASISQSYERPSHHHLFRTLRLDLRDFKIHMYNPKNQSKSWKIMPQNEEKKTKPGGYPFVRVYPEDFLRMGFRPFEVGKACGHPLLAEGKCVLYAGELVIGENEEIIEWNNKSGFYRPSANLAHQAGLPLDKFWVYSDNVGSRKLDFGWLTKLDPNTTTIENGDNSATQTLFNLLDT